MGKTMKEVTESSFSQLYKTFSTLTVNVYKMQWPEKLYQISWFNTYFLVARNNVSLYEKLSLMSRGPRSMQEFFQNMFTR